MLTVYLLKGLPASGKSTWARQKLCANPGACKRVNKDDLRQMLDDGKWSKHNEKFVLAVRDAIILEALESGKHVIVDDTNLHPKHEVRLRELIKGKARLEVVDHFLEVGREECVARDLKRDRSVGRDVIEQMHRQFLVDGEGSYLPDYTKPKAYIFDVDGTLAKMEGRSPYDWDRVLQDGVNLSVSYVCEVLKNAGYKILIFTGRDGVCREDTEEWLRKAGVEYDHFDIRPAGNTEKDSIVKKRMFDKVKDEYNICGVFDDRDQVVEMWRSLGLTCFQVDYGNF